MRDTHNKSLRREFLGIGLTGAMAGLAGCSNVIGSDEEGPNIDTAGFSFSYDEATKQVQIEFVGGAAIDAGNVRIQNSAGREVLWAELGSTTAGVDEDIEAGAVAVLGPDILNWEMPIEGGETIRVIYVGKETPATLERYSSPEPTESESESESTNNQIEPTPEIRLNDEIPNGFKNGGATRQESNSAVGNYVWSFSGDYILSDYAWGTTDHSGTLCCWVYIPEGETNKSERAGILSAHDGGRGGDYEFAQLSLSQWPNGEGVGLHKNKPNTEQAKLSVTDFPVDEWFHLTGVVDKSKDELRVYLNGVQKDSHSDFPISMEQMGEFGIGARAKRRDDQYIYDRYFDGKLDDVRVYTEALSDEDINSLASMN